MGAIGTEKKTRQEARPSQITYSKPNVTKKWLLSHGFHYDLLFSDDEAPAYSMRFPVLEYDSYPILEGELTIILGNQDPEIGVDVYSYGTYEVYPAFYYQKYGNYDVILETIWQNIDKKLQQLRIEKIEGKDKSNGNQNQKTKRKRKNPNKREQSGGGLRLVRSNDFRDTKHQTRTNGKNRNGYCS